MRYLVLGAGALGGLFGARLLKGGADVTYLVRPRRASQLRNDGLIVRTQDGEIRNSVRAIQKHEVDGPYDVVLLACKAYDLDGALDAIAPAVGPGTAILPLLNGIRHIETLQARFGKSHVLGGLTAINAALLPDGTIQQSQLRINMNVLGELDGIQSPRCIAIADSLIKGGIPAEVSKDVIAALWSKFLGYASLATIASITRARAGAVARSAAGSAFVAAVLDECKRVIAAEGFQPAPELPDMLRSVYAQPDSTYAPSILVDMEEGRPTEGEHTIGDLVDRATRRGIAVPILTSARCNLQAYEVGRSSGGR